MVAQNRCAEIRLRAERKLGELLSVARHSGEVAGCATGTAAGQTADAR
jgi:hypothetical protein